MFFSGEALTHGLCSRTGIDCVAFSPDGRTFAAGGGNLTLWTIG